MTLHRTLSNEISEAQQTLAKADEVIDEFGAIFNKGDRFCEFDPETWQPVTVDGVFAPTMTDDELAAANFDFTAQELCTALFATAATLINVSSQLRRVIGKVKA